MEAILAKDLMNGLSKNGDIPWKSKTDMKFFYNTTKNNVVIMGKNTYYSLPEHIRPLKNRLNIVLTRQVIAEKQFDNLLFTNELEVDREKLLADYSFLKPDFKIFIIGGNQIYEKYIPFCSTVWLTQIKGNYQCDLIFDEKLLNPFQIKQIEYEDDELCIMKYFNSYLQHDHIQVISKMNNQLVIPIRISK
jgi:dihydrofolate reductase